jgi:regulator of nucleoside diphosphate kinase
MSNDACILTTKDLTILEVMLDRCLRGDDPMVPILKRKINAAQIVFRDDVPADVATLNSRVVFSVDGRDPDTRIISHDRVTSPIGLFLPLTTFRGLALLGLSEGQEFSLPGQDSALEKVRLEKVAYQPEAARREKKLLDRTTAAVLNKPVLGLIRGARYGQPELVAVKPSGPHDPGGPSVA